MRKIIFTTFIITAVISCSKKADSNGEIDRTMPNIAGNYTATAQITTTNGVVFNTYDSSFPKPCDKKSVYSFTQFGDVTMADSCTGLSSNESYRIEGNLLIINTNEVSTITSLTNNNLVLTKTDTVNNSPLEIETTATTFSRK
jgi:hypothetical protein